MRYYRKMLFTFLSMTIIFTVLVDIIFLVGYRRSAYSEFHRATDAIATQAGEYTDYQLRAFQEMGMLLQATESLGRYLQEDPLTPNRYNRFLLYKFINSVHGVASTNKRNLAVTKVVDDYVILNNMTGNIENMLDVLGITRTQFEDTIASFSGQLIQPIRLIPGVDSQGLPLYTVVTRQWVGRPYPFYLLVSYSEDQLFSVEDGTLAVIYQGELWHHSGMLDTQTVEALLDGGKTSLVRRDMASAIAGFSYVYWTAPPMVIGTSSGLIIASGALVMAVSVYLMLRFTRRMYSPIADTLSVVGVELSAGDEFSELQSTINSLKTDVKTMSQSLSQYYETVENKFFHDLVTGLVPQDAIQEKMRQFGISDSQGAYLAVLVQFEETLEPGTDIRHTTLFDGRAMLRHSLTKGRGLLRTIDVDMTSQCYIFRQVDVAFLQEYLRGILLTVEPEYGLEITAYIGIPVDTLSIIHHSFRAALRLSEDSAYEPVRAKVITKASRPTARAGSEHNVYYPLRTEQMLINAVIHGRIAVMESTLREIIQTNRQEYPGNHSPLSLMLTATINRILDGVKQKATDIFEDDTIIFLEFRICEEYDTLEAKAIALFTTLASYLAAIEKESIHSIEQQMTSFIMSNYTRDISLFDLADHVNMSKNYVSTLFRNSTGQTFKDYVGTLRHKKATELINENPEVQMRVVAKQVGCSPDTLLRLFIKYSGISPSDYQLQVKQSRDEWS